MVNQPDLHIQLRRNYMRKFSDTQVNEIRHRVNVLGESRASVATRVNASRSAVSSVANYTTYRDVPAPRPIPGFSNNYLVYPNGKVWSYSRNHFLRETRKSSASNTRYVNLRNGFSRKSVRVNELVNTLF